MLGRAVGDRLLTRGDSNQGRRDVSLSQGCSGGNGSGSGEDGDSGELHCMLSERLGELMRKEEEAVSIGIAAIYSRSVAVPRHICMENFCGF